MYYFCLHDNIAKLQPAYSTLHFCFHSCDLSYKTCVHTYLTHIFMLCLKIITDVVTCNTIFFGTFTTLLRESSQSDTCGRRNDDVVLSHEERFCKDPFLICVISMEAEHQKGSFQSIDRTGRALNIIIYDLKNPNSFINEDNCLVLYIFMYMYVLCI